eukprot:15115118-Ditylum_brightwellii.AAC.1
MHEVDCVVVGGGIVGTALTYCLSKFGIQTTLLEQSAFGTGGSTGLSAATVWCGVDLATTEHDEKKQQLTDLEEDMYLCAKSRQLYKEVKCKECQYMETGALEIATSATELSFLRHQWDTYQQRTSGKTPSLQAEWLNSNDAVRQKEPALSQSVLGAIHTPLSGFVSTPIGCARAFADAAERMGAICAEGARVTNV